MKFNTYFFILSFLTTVLLTAQTENHTMDSLSIDKKINDAITLYQKYEYKKALAITKECIKKSDSLKNDILLGRSYILNGIIVSYLDEEKEALKSHRKAEAIFTKIKNYKMLGITYHNIAFAFQRGSKNIDSTILYYKKALETYEYIEDTEKTALTCSNLGKNYIKINQLKKAEKYLTKAIQLAKVHNRKKVLSRAYYNYAEVYTKKNLLHKALAPLNISQEIAEKENYVKDLALIYQLKSEILEKLGDIKNSYIYLKKYEDYLIRDHKIEKSRLAQEAAIKFEVKESKALLEKTNLENITKENKLKKSRLTIFFSAILFLISVIASLLLYKNNILKSENNKLLVHKNEELKELQTQTELNFLKTQIQPHFFFNTLNNLHTLLLKKSDRPKEIVLKLSELMQYTLYGANNISVPILNEINNIQNYLELESLRYDKKGFPPINIRGNIDGIQVPPLLYIPFIENCFKHNNVNDTNFELLISFKNENEKHLIFTVKNSFNKMTNSNQKKNIGVGIKNVKRRLELIYKDNFELNISTENNFFSIELKTPISI